MSTKLGLPLFAFLTRGFYSTPVMVQQDSRISYIYLFSSKEKASAYRNKLKMDVLIVQIQSWLGLRNFLTLPPGVDPAMFRTLDVSLDSFVSGDRDNAMIVPRIQLLEISESQYQKEKVASRDSPLSIAISEMENRS